jgi:hypothetical protein
MWRRGAQVGWSSGVGFQVAGRFLAHLVGMVRQSGLSGMVSSTRVAESARGNESASRPLVDFGVLNDNLIK